MPMACHSFSILKEKFWQGKTYPPPSGIGLSVLSKSKTDNEQLKKIREDLNKSRHKSRHKSQK